MAIESSYPAVLDLTGTEIIPVITTPGVAGGTKTITGTNFAASTLVTERIKTVMGANLIAGANMTITVNTPANTVTLTAGTASTYTDAMARAAIGAASVGDTGYLTVTPNTGAATITYAIDPAFKARVATLETKSLVQSNDNVVAGGAVYVSLPGTAGSYVSTPSTAALNLAGNMELTVRVAMTDWTPLADQVIMSKYGAAGQFSWRLQLKTTGFLALTASADGTIIGTGTTTVAPTVADGAAIWIRVLRNSGTGQTDFSYAADQPTEPTTFTTLTLNRGTVVGATFASTADVEFGAYATGASSPANGKFYRGLIRTGTGGTLVADMNAADWTSGSTWTGPVGGVWTLNGSAAISSGAGGGVSNTSTEFVLTTIDAHPTIPVAQHDTMMFFSNFALTNTSASSATFTPRVTMNGISLFTFPAITVAPGAGASQTGSLAVRIVMNALDGSGQIASAELAVGNSVSGNTDLGGVVSATDQTRMTGNRVLTGATTFTSVPLIEMRITMSIANAGITSRRLSSQLFLAKA